MMILGSRYKVDQWYGRRLSGKTNKTIIERHRNSFFCLVYDHEYGAVFLFAITYSLEIAIRRCAERMGVSVHDLKQLDDSEGEVVELASNSRSGGSPYYH